MERASGEMSRNDTPREESSADARLVLPDGRWSIPGTWLWREPTGRFARVDLAEVIYLARWVRL
jgi:hypothetical protein